MTRALSFNTSLSDLKHDPGQSKNLSSDYPGRVKWVDRAHEVARERRVR